MQDHRWFKIYRVKNIGNAFKVNDVAFRLPPPYGALLINKLNKSLVLSILLYECESWTLTADLERRIEAFENKSYRRMLDILYIQRAKTNEYVLQQARIVTRHRELLLSTVKRRKLGHVCQKYAAKYHTTIMYMEQQKLIANHHTRASVQVLQQRPGVMGI